MITADMAPMNGKNNTHAQPGMGDKANHLHDKAGYIRSQRTPLDDVEHDPKPHHRGANNHGRSQTHACSRHDSLPRQPVHSSTQVMKAFPYHFGLGGIQISPMSQYGRQQQGLHSCPRGYVYTQTRKRRILVLPRRRTALWL